jgi:hypothetical protein
VRRTAVLAVLVLAACGGSGSSGPKADEGVIRAYCIDRAKNGTSAQIASACGETLHNWIVDQPKCSTDDFKALIDMGITQVSQQTISSYIADHCK